MRVVLRVFAVLLGVLALLTVYGVGVFASSIGFASLRTFPGLMALTIVCWVVTIVGGVIAAMQLWRFRRSGWWAALAVLGAGLLYYTVGFTAFRGPGAHFTTVAIYIALYLLGVIILVLPACRRVIQPSA